MKYLKYLFIVLSCFSIFATTAAASDFDWIKDLNIEVKGDESGFNTTLKTRFKIGDVQVKAVLGSVDNPADAYMVFRVAELSRRPAGDVLEQYKKSRGKGWGVIARGLGIKPGSSAFHALKSGHDLNVGKVRDRDDGHGKGKGRGKK